MEWIAVQEHVSEYRVYVLSYRTPKGEAITDFHR